VDRCRRALLCWSERAGDIAQKTVLVVNDDPSILVVVRIALQLQGYAVVTAVGATAVPLAAERQPDVILLDVHMPGMDGP
jgi:CheY-like chemotaxis protein